jgi:phosphoribosyl 1,2-cyclic phosphodiesterase
MEATLTFLGSGTSMGVPTLGCDCAVCASAISPNGDPRNRRTRPSIGLGYDGHTVLIDTGPDFHAQAIREGIRRVDAVLYTHGHADHVMGFDDLRPSAFTSRAICPSTPTTPQRRPSNASSSTPSAPRTAIPPAPVSNFTASTPHPAPVSISSAPASNASRSLTAASRSPATASAAPPTSPT